MHYSVVFLIDTAPPAKILLLKRGDFMRYAPGWYTGIGGKIEPGETCMQGALRELHEESGLTGLELTEFARCIVENDVVLHYYVGQYEGAAPDCDEGDLEWVAAAAVLHKAIIPDTAAVMAEWQRRNFAASPAWTLFVRRGAAHDGIHDTVIDKFMPDLYEIE